MKTFILSTILLIAFTAISANAGVKPVKPDVRHETFVTIDLVQVDDHSFCNTTDSELAPHTTAVPDVLIGIMLAAKQSGLEIQRVDENTCLE